MLYDFNSTKTQYNPPPRDLLRLIRSLKNLQQRITRSCCPGLQLLACHYPQLRV